jgi:hypothetical protein
MLEQKHIVVRPEMARRLLQRAVGIVANSALYGLVMFSIGCIIPTPLDREPAKVNYKPSFVGSQVQPAFGPAAASLTAGTTLVIAATDPNGDDTLTVRLFEPDPAKPGGFLYLNISQQLDKPTTPDPADLNLRITTLDPPLCLNASDQTKFDLYAVVADRAFSADNPMRSDGLTDTNHWEITCTSSM